MKGRRFYIRQKIFTLVGFVSIPFIIMVIFLLVSMVSYSRMYGQVIGNMTIANNYNIDFKEEMDESLYKLVVGYVSFDNISDKETLSDPYELINDLRGEFTRLAEITDDVESGMWLESLLRNIDTLEDRVDDIVENVEIGGRYDENIEELDNNIYILTELIQDDIQYYIYYQTQSMEQINNELDMQIQRFIVICGIMAGVLAILAAVLTNFWTNSITRPIRDLNKAMEKTGSGDFSARAQLLSKDELGELSKGFNDMAGSMQKMIDKIKEDEAKMRRADLRILQEQINPHFLYNTLDTIVWLIEGEQPDKAVEMVVTLSSFFRMVLSKGKEFISIREEEQHIKSYLEIQQMRYGDILNYDIRIDSAVYDYKIPKLTLQPLVENALYHGIKYKRAEGYIHVNGERKNGIIILTVRDNGVGMEAEELEVLRQEIEKPCKETDRGFGLANVNERIHMYFGYEYGMKIKSEKGKGTIVEISIPAISTDTDDEEKNPQNGGSER